MIRPHSSVHKTFLVNMITLSGEKSEVNVRFFKEESVFKREKAVLQTLLTCSTIDDMFHVNQDSHETMVTKCVSHGHY